MLNDWILIENRSQWKTYKDNLVDQKILRDQYETVGEHPKGKIKVEHMWSNKPEQYPCLVSSVLNTSAYQYDHEFIYYEDALKLVNSKEEQTDGSPKK